MTFAVNALVLIAVACLNLAIGAHVVLRGPQRSANRAFSIMAATTALWTVGVGFAHFGPLHLAGVQLAWASGALIPLALLNFVLNFPVPSRPGPLLWSSAFLSLSLAFLAWSRFIVDNSTTGAEGLQVSYGPLQPLFVTYVTLSFTLALYLLYRKHKCSVGMLRLQLRYLLYALAIPTTLSLLTNVFVPMFTGISDSGRYGPVFSLIMVITVGHAIVRHRLMDVRMVVRRGVTYLAAMAVAAFLLLLLLLGFGAIVLDAHELTSRQVVLSLFVAMLFPPLKNWVQRGFNRYLYRESYDYQQEIRETSRALNRTIELSLLLEQVGKTLERTLRPEWHASFILDQETRVFARIPPVRVSGVPDLLELPSPIVDRLSQDCRVIFRDEPGANADALVAEMCRLNVDVIVPLAAEGLIIGLVVIGPKRSGDPFFSDDADLLNTLAHQSSVAIRNAQAHQQVLEANEYIERILRTIESGVISVSARGQVSLFNRAAESMTGCRVEQIRGSDLHHLPKQLAALLEATLHDGQCRNQSELALPDSAGQMIPVMCSTTPLVGPYGAVVGAVAVVNDLSRLKELEREKRRAEHLASIDAIAVGLVHEIRNPLVAIKTFTQLLPSRGDDPEFRNRVAAISEREITRVETIVRRFRSLAMPASEPMEPVDVTQPLQAALDLLGPQLAERQIRLRQVADGTPRPILGNASQLEQLFLNVCLNAVEAMEPGGELTVRVADLCAAGGVTLIVEVCDTGSGIPDDVLPTIFNPFVTTKPHGSGLGLAICRSIADAHRATLTARNNAGRPGSTFTIELPVPTGSAAALRS